MKYKNESIINTSRIIKNLDIYLAQDFQILDKLVKKIDVNKVLYCEYHDFDFKKSVNKKEVSSSIYICLYNKLVETEDYKFLNSALKLNDLLVKKNIITKTRQEENLEYLKNRILNI